MADQRQKPLHTEPIKPYKKGKRHDYLTRLGIDDGRQGVRPSMLDITACYESRVDERTSNQLITSRIEFDGSRNEVT